LGREGFNGDEVFFLRHESTGDSNFFSGKALITCEHPDRNFSSSEVFDAGLNVVLEEIFDSSDSKQVHIAFDLNGL
jgi:hypothetical protein